MKKLAIACLVTLGACSPSKPSKHVIENPQKAQYLFVLSAQSGSYEENELKLNSIPLVVYFSDRPQRVAGHLSVKKFIKQWNAQNDSDSPSNATLSILENGKTKDITIDLSDTKLDDDQLIFKVKSSESKIPANFGPSSVFIDTF